MVSADAGFISFILCRWLVANGHVFVLRVGSNVRLLTKLVWDFEVEGKTVSLWPKKERHLPPAVLRLIVIRKENRWPDSLVTNVLDEELLSEVAAAEIYALRWGLEVHYRSQKQTLDRARLCRRRPGNALAELHRHAIATWVLQLLTAQELMDFGKAPASWSAATACDAHDVPQRSGEQKLFANEMLPEQAATHDDPRRPSSEGSETDPECPRKKKETPLTCPSFLYEG